VLSAADELWRSVRTYGTGDRAELVVGYGASASYETGPRLLARLAHVHPGISIAASVRSTGEIVAGVADGSIDLGLVRCPPRTPELDTRVIRFERQVVLLRRDHRLASQRSVGVAELAEEAMPERSFTSRAPRPTVKVEAQPGAPVAELPLPITDTRSAEDESGSRQQERHAAIR
jgi:LysR substrate binding domain-containing protein